MHSSTKRLFYILVAVLALASLAAALSIPQKHIVDGKVEIKNHRLFKRGTGRAHVVAAPTSQPRPGTTTTRRATTPEASRPATSTARPTSSAAASSTPAAASSAPASSTPSAAPAGTSADTNASSIVPSATSSPTSTDTPVPTGGLSTGAIGGIGAVAGVAVVGAGIFAAVRYKRKASLTQNLGSKVNQYSTSAPYLASTPFPAGPNTGYERLSDPSLSGASVPSGIIGGGGMGGIESLGTYTVISTYTPTLGDELEIQPGDKVTILIEYDDGWCQGVNESRGRVKGVFPKHCVDYGNQSGEDVGRGKRVSSMYGSGGYRM